MFSRRSLESVERRLPLSPAVCSRPARLGTAEALFTSQIPRRSKHQRASATGALDNEQTTFRSDPPSTHSALILGPSQHAMLLRAWLELARDRGAPAVHVGVNRANARALRFWARRGFQPLTADSGAERTARMGHPTISG